MHDKGLVARAMMTAPRPPPRISTTRRGADNTVANGFRHSLWNSLMRRSSPESRDYAGLALATVHEDGHWKDTNPRIVERKRSQMDVLNNFVGVNHPGSTDMIACEDIRYRAVRGNFITAKPEPMVWARNNKYEYYRPVYRKLKQYGTDIRVYPTGNHCTDIRVGWGPEVVNPFEYPWNAISE